MEDEECLPENSSLKLYLQNLGFTDIPVTKIAPRDPSRLLLEVSKPKTNTLETIDEDVIDQVSIIISTQMLFEEDIARVEKLLSNFKVVKNEMLKSMFKDLFGVAVIFLGLCLFWVIGYYAFLIVSSFYAFAAAKYLSRKHFNRSRIKKLTSILQSNFILLKKIVKFIEENRSLEYSACKNSSFEFIGGFDFYNNFKSDFALSLNEMINVLVKSTQKLIIKIPLCDYIENPEIYLCNNLKENYNSLNISHLYQIYLLLQSEFLQRLILCLIPNIKLSTKDGFQDLNKILTETCVNLLKLKNKFNKKFKVVFINGIYSKPHFNFKLPFKHKSDNKYVNEFILNVHETSNTFQKLLLQCRVLEEKLTSDKISEFAEQELSKIQESLNTCQQNITDSLILFKKANFIRDSPKAKNEVKVQDEKEIKCSNERINKIMVGYSDLDPAIEDEIFEACFSNENSNTDMSNVDVWDLEENLVKKQKKEFCKNVMSELKIKLKEKAKYWKRRERELLKKKGIINVDEYEEETETSDQERDDEDIVDNLDIQKPLECQNIVKNFESSSKNEFKNFEEDPSVEMSKIPLECQEHYASSQGNKTFKSGITNEDTCEVPKESLKSVLTYEDFDQSFSKNFLNDLNQARLKIFKSCAATEEESFYASGEDSSSEDS